MRPYKHTCIKPYKPNEEFHYRTCKACVEKKTTAEIRKEFEKMMKVLIAWDDEGQGEIL